MRFGAQFRDAVDPSLSMHGVPYKDLKKRIKHLQSCCDSLGEGCCQSVDDSSLGHVDLEDPVGPGLDQLLSLSSTGPVVLGAAGDEGSDEDLRRVEHMELGFLKQIQLAIRRLNGLVVHELASTQDEDHLQQLTSFADLNRIAIVKIIKKYHKKIGRRIYLQQLVEQLPEEPFVKLLVEVQPTPAEPEVPAGRSGGPSELAEPMATSSLEATPSATEGLSQQGRPWAFTALRRNVCNVRNVAACVIAGLLYLFASLAPESIGGVLKGLVLLGLFLDFASRCIAYCQQGSPSKVAKPEEVVCTWARLLCSELPHEGQRMVKLQGMIVHTGGNGTAPWAEPAGETNDAEIAASAILEDRALECSCCLADVEPEEVIALLPCGHIFHEDCIVAWAGTGTSGAEKCPLCRTGFQGQSTAR